MAKIPPLSWQTPIVDADSGKPTSFFIQLWQKLFAIQYIRIIADRTIIKYSAVGALTPASQDTTFTAVKTNSADTTTWSLKDNLGNPLSITAFSSGSDTDTVTMTAAQFTAAIAVNGSTGLNVIASVTDGGEDFRDEATLTKVQDGAAGTALDAQVLTIYSDRQQILYDGTGNPNPSTQTTTFNTNKVNTTATVFWTLTDSFGNTLTPVTTYLSAASGDSVTMTRAQFEAAIAVHSARGVVVQGQLTDNGTWTHRVSVVRVQDGNDGSVGLTGPAGTSSYFHTAYADSSDGTVNFTTSDTPAGRTFIGVRVDTTSTDSSTPSDYNWSQLVGEDGGAGTPGADGYVHRAYADSADGSVNFTVGSPGTRTYIGWYQDHTAADSTSYTSYTWSKFVGATGATGSTGSPGASAINLSAIPNPITVACTAGGTPKAALPSFTLKAEQAGADVTSSVTYGTITSTNMSGVSRSGAVISVTGMSADVGTITVPVTNAGASASITVTYTKAYDGAAYVYDGATVGTPTTSYSVVATVTLLMGPSGNIEVDTNGGFAHAGGGSTNVDGYFEYSLNGGGSYTSFGSFTGNPALTSTPGDWGQTAGLVGSTIGLSTRQSVIINLQMKKNGGPAFSSFSGDMSVNWSG